MRAASLSPSSNREAKRRQRGVAMVEFALVALIFFTLLLGIMEFGRWMFTLNAASEATRWGARLAAVCGMNDAIIKTRMKLILSGVSDSQISIRYLASDGNTNCDYSTCTTVQVALVNASFTPLIPFMGVAVPIPPFTTSFPRELMKSTVDGTVNPACS